MFKTKYNLINLVILASFSPYGMSETIQSDESLEEINVSANENMGTKPSEKVGEIKKDAKLLSKQQVSNSRDLVRYETGVTAVEAGGRFGSSGYAIRGVDENRVAITIDGLHQAETLSSQGFKDLFEAYGNFNNTRNSVEMENVKTATITKGADSIKAGSGALGGSVMFETKDARDYLIDKDYHFSYKRGYQSADRQNSQVLTAAAKYKWFDFLIIDTNRKGHETKNYFYNIYDNSDDFSHVGKRREKTDPYNIERHSTLVKFGFQPSQNHRFSVALDDSKLDSKGYDLSYVLRHSSLNSATTDGQRINHDKSHRKNTSFTYENFNQTPFWDSLKISYSSQKITNTARTDNTCFQDTCPSVLDPAGSKLDQSGSEIKIVDKNGAPLKSVMGTGWWADPQPSLDGSTELADWKSEKLSFNSLFINCSVIDCNKKIGFWYDVNEKPTQKYFNIKKLTQNGKEYGVVDGSSNGNSETSGYFFRPNSQGFDRNNYQDRDLNTDTKQINLDLTKSFSVFQTEHELKYGGLLSKTDKQMVDKDGTEPFNVKWWANSFFKANMDCSGWPCTYSPNFNKLYTSDFAPTINGISSFLIPVKTKTKSLYFGDDIKVTDWLGFDLNYRYDRVKHLPGYDYNIPVPKGLITDVFIPGNCGNAGYNDPCYNKNFDDNLKYLLTNKTFKHHSYSLATTLDPLDWMRVQFKYSNGFRVPTSDEMYMTFKHPDFSIKPNVNLEAEVAKTKEVALTLHHDSSFITFNVFRTDYKNFIDLAYLGDTEFKGSGSILTYPTWQNINREKAKITGFEVNSHFELGDISSLMNGFHFGYKLTLQKGKIQTKEDGKVPMNAIQPTTSVFNIGYITPNNNYGIDFYITHALAKKASDTYNMYWRKQKDNEDIIVQGKRVSDSKVAWRNNRYTVLDAIAFAKPIKNLTLSLGMYNITNAKYLTWDSARSIHTFGTTNLIDQNTGAGIGRFYAPKRNFKFNVEFSF